MDLKNKLNVGHMGNKCIFFVYFMCSYYMCGMCIFVCEHIWQWHEELVKKI